MNSPTGRKIRTERTLKELGIPINKNLPALVNKEDFWLRATTEIINRIISITIVSAKGSGAPEELIDKYIKKFDAMELFSEYEREFILCDDPGQDELNYYLWKIECNSVFLWALQFTPSLSLSNDLPNAEYIYRTILESTKEDLFIKAKLRSINEILDELDFVYRLHWAIADARTNQKELPLHISPGVIYERRYALSWLVHYMNKEWDEITMAI